MNKRQVIFLWIIALVLASAVAVVKLGQKDPHTSTTQRAAGQTLFENFPATSVAAIDFHAATGSVSLALKEGKWTVTQRDNFPAKATSINEFLRTIAELKVTRCMEAGPSFAPRFGMDESATVPDARGITATFKDASGKEIAKVSLGKNIESTQENPSPYGGGAMPVGRYLRNHADSSGFYASSETFSSIATEIPSWLLEDFISPEKIQSVTLSQKGKADPAWKVTRDTEDAELKLADAKPGESLDTTASSSLKTLFSYARFDDVVPADQVAARADTANQRTAQITTFEGFSYQLTLTPVKGDDSKQLLTVQVSADLPKERKKVDGEKPEDAKTKDQAFTDRLKNLTEKLDKEKALAGRTFEISKSSLDALLKERDQLLAKPAAPAAGAAPATPPTAGTVPEATLNESMIPATPTPTGAPANTPTRKPVEAVTPPIEVPASGQ